MENVSVLNFGTYIAGPLTAKHLQNMGAKITTVKCKKKYAKEIEWNEILVKEFCSNHDVYFLDMTEEYNTVVELVKKCDVMISNFRNGVMNKWNLSYEQCKNINSNIIYVTLPAFSIDDLHNNETGWDNVIMAICGVFKDMGLNRQLMHIPASYTSLTLPSVYSSIFAALAISSKLFFNLRQKNQVSHKIEVPLSSSLLEALAHNSIDFNKPEMYKKVRERMLNTDVMTYDEVNEIMDPFFSHYYCADNRPIYLVSPSHIDHQIKVLKMLDIDSNDFPFADPYNNHDSSKYGLGGVQMSDAHSKHLKQLFIVKFKEKTSHEWEILFGQHKIPGIAHRTFSEWIKCPHAIQSGLCTYDNKNRLQIAPIAWSNNIKTGDPSTLHANNIPFCLSNINVLDMSNVIAGPTIGAMLARMGANVTKIDSTNPSYAPDITIIYGLIVNREKSSILLNINEPSGRDKLIQLIKQTHVIICNCTHQALHRLDLDIDTLRKYNSNIILVHFDAWGGPREMGSLIEHIGYDDNVQAGTGIMSRFGGGLNTVEEHAHVGTIDVIAGVAGAFSAICALLKLLLNKQTCVARTSLAACSQHLQINKAYGTWKQINQKQLTSFDSMGIACRGEHALCRCYEARDEWFLFVASLNMNKHTLKDVLRKFKQNIHIRFAETFLTEIFKTNTVDHWKKVFSSYCVVKLQSISCLREKHTYDQINISNLHDHTPSIQFVKEHHAIGTLVSVAPIAIIMSNIKYTLSHAKQYGEGSVNRWSQDYLPYMYECPICFDMNPRKLELICNHYICIKCAMTCSVTGNNQCPICRKEQNMDVFSLKSNTILFRNNYRRWRMGCTKGAQDMETIRKVSSHVDIFDRY